MKIPGRRNEGKKKKRNERESYKDERAAKIVREKEL